MTGGGGGGGGALAAASKHATALLPASIDVRTAALALAVPVVSYVLLVLLRCLACLLSPAYKNRNVGKSCLYVGRVWHARYLPAVHKFGYGLFYTYLDLDHLDETFAGLWPLAAYSPLQQQQPPSSSSAAPAAAAAPKQQRGSGWLARRLAMAEFKEKDHLKDVPVDLDPTTGRPLPLAERVRNLVQRETGARPTGPVCLLTHLRYLGYVFNPVSFYYVWDAKGENLETVVAEVSNTPWNEMHCYVLNPKTPGVKAKAVTKEGAAVWNYVFNKDFHVSPFMEMDHVYDWDFRRPDETMWVVTHMLKQGKDRYFTARFDMAWRAPTLPNLLLCILRFPLITWAVQFLIHLQAFRLWLKKVPFYDHPQGTKTWASSAVAFVMAPLWKVQALLDGSANSDSSKEKSS